jgi:hypothetical protein
MFTMTGSMEMKVDKVTSDQYDMVLSGSADVSGSFENMSVSGTVDISGSMTRAKSNFGTISTTFIMNMSMTTSILTLNAEVGVKTTATPPLNDLPINQNLAPGTHIWSNTTVSGLVWFNFVGFMNNSETISESEDLEIIVGANETVTTPAGTFECVKLTAGSGTDAMTYFYSPKVGNYVKMTGNGSMNAGFGALGDMTLKSYSYGKSSSGISSFVTGKYWWVTVLIIVVIVVIIVAAVMMRKRGRAPQMAPAPVQQAPPPPA